MTDLVATARTFVSGGRGFLANDEMEAHATAYLGSFGIPGGSEMRRKYHDLFASTDGLEAYVSGIIYSAGTFDERADSGQLFPEFLAAKHIAPGIKVDGGLEPMPGSENETVTQGLIGLTERLATFKERGATFTKWRAALKIDGDQLPSAQAMLENSKRLATYAKEVQMAGLVPMLEPEVLLKGVHSRARARDVMQEMISTLFSVLQEHSVDRASVILKTSMALTGSDSPKKDTPEEVAEATLEALMSAVPRQIAGVVFLSGGQDPEQATENLSAIARRAKALDAPWPLTFSYARALQEEALQVWQGKDENVGAARKVFLERLKRVSAATRGE